MKSKLKEILSNIKQFYGGYQNLLHSGIEISIIQNIQRSAQRHRKKKREEPIRKAGASYFGRHWKYIWRECEEENKIYDNKK